MGKGGESPHHHPFSLSTLQNLCGDSLPWGFCAFCTKVAGPVAASATGIFIIPRRRKFVKPFLQNKFFYFFS
jgi:hypothetical protein